METIKSKEQFFQPDPRSMGLGPPLETQYEMLEYFSLHEGVPESVRSYMASIVTLWLYGWLYYPFYTTAGFLAFTAVEMALKARLPKKLSRKGRDPRGLSDLLKEAKDAGLLRDDGFRNVHERVVPGQLYVDVLIAILPNLRNRFAHPDMHTIVSSGLASDTLTLASEIMNQLWKKPAS